MTTQKARDFTYNVLCKYGILEDWSERQDALPIISKLLKAAVTYNRVQEDICNGHPACSSPTLPTETVNRLQEQFERETERRDEMLSRRLEGYAKDIPGIDAIELGGDPRGATVKLMLVTGRGDSWDQTDDGRHFVCVPVD